MAAKVQTPPPITGLNSTSSKAQMINMEGESSKLSKNNTDTPSPIDIEKFLPWLCLQFEISVELIVKKTIKAKYVSKRKVCNILEEKPSSGLNTSESKPDGPSIHPSLQKTSTPLPSNKIPVTACFDTSGCLSEIAIIKSPVKIEQKAIKCINMCLPFHPSMLKFKIAKGGLTSEVVYEVAKILPLSYITDVCIDDCNVKEGNYYILLDNISPLKVLTLKRCRINDIALKEITKRMDMGQPGSSLTVLNLASNQITDRGAWYLGDILRRNRSLLHLCLSNNKITSMGLNYIIDPLKEFQMNQEEIYGMRKRRFQFIERIGIPKLETKRESRKSIVSQETLVQIVTATSSKSMGRKEFKKKKPSTLNVSKVIAAPAERPQFIDIFDDDNVKVRDDNIYCIGNLSLCSLNLAYNEVDFLGVKRILDVVVYQSKVVKAPSRTGLMRLVLDGNLIPKHCDELNQISLLLSSVITSASHHSTRTLKSRSK